MSGTLTVLAAGAASLALAAGLIAIAHRLHTIEKGPAPPTPETARTERTSARPLLSSLYREPQPSPWTALSTLPGGPWVAVAAVLALVALGSAALQSTPTPAAPAPADSAVTRLHARIDSLAGLVLHLQDSLRLTAQAEPAARAAAPTTRLARRSPPATSTVPPAPAPPTLSPAQ